VFWGARAFNQPLNNWNVGNVTNMDFMFHNASAFNQDISGWDVDQVSGYSGIFDGATKMNENPFYMPPRFRPSNWRSSGNFFITRWNISNTNTSKYASGESNSNQIKLPLHSSGRYDFTVDWGDDSQSTITRHDQAAITHSYAAAGEYTVMIGGTIEGFGFWRDAGFSGYFDRVVGDSAKLIDVRSWGPVQLHSHGGQFMRARNLGGFPATGTLDLSNVTDMSHMFHGAHAFNQPPDNWNVGNVTDMSYMFQNAGSFNQDIRNWNVDQVRSYEYMFHYAFMMNANPQYKPPRFR